jgi:uncharacterized protein
MRIAITGGTGFIGSALRSHFSARGDEVLVVTRSPERAGTAAIGWDPKSGELDGASLEGLDVVVHLAGKSIFDLWTPGARRVMRDSRVRGTTLLAATLAGLERKPKLLLSGSGINYYGPGRREPLTERDPPGTGFFAALAREWEAATGAAEAAGIRVAHLRTSPVLSPDGGMLAAMLPFFRTALAPKFGDGRGCWPWIALEDYAPIVEHLIAHEEIRGAVNITAPETVTNAEFTDAVAAAVGRPAFLRVPAFLARLAPGGMADELLLGNPCAVPQVLLDSGYAFRQPRLRPALDAMLRRS